MKNAINTIKFYGTIGALILGWWFVAFQSHPTKAACPQFSDKKQLSSLNSPSTLLNSLSPMKRTTLHAALSGDVSLMTKLMAEWDLDAEIMKSRGVKNVQRLPHTEYIRAQTLGRIFKNASNEEFKALSDEHRLRSVEDDNGILFSLETPSGRFLPQTYVASSFLLALADPKQIVAIPRGLREQRSLFSPELTDRIPLNIDRYNSEKLFMENPQVAFVAHYSHPSILQALHQQGIQLFTLKDIQKIPEISDTLLRVGHVINRPLEAELLKLFIEASMIAIDNRFLALNLNFSHEVSPPRFLFLSYHTHYLAPTERTLTGQLLKRIGIQNLASYSSKHLLDWTIPLDQEQIINFDPEYLVISTTNQESMKRQISETPAFDQLSAIRDGKLYFVDESIQNSPSQYIVLAYFDIFSALAHSQLP